MGVTAWAAKNLVQDRRVSMAQAQVMLKNAQSKSGFPVVVNDLVLKQLNRYIGTPEGREYMRASLQRMESYRSLVEGKIKQYGAPEELMAVPIVESGYQNLKENGKAGRGAGLWMFIKPTAHRFGLSVDSPDQRLNESLLTDAAMRYLLSNYLRFNDWPLAVLGYNVGEQGVEDAMEDTGARDAWTLIRGGHENDRDYLPSVMAAILIMRNPQSVN